LGQDNIPFLLSPLPDLTSEILAKTSGLAVLILIHPKSASIQIKGGAKLANAHHRLIAWGGRDMTNFIDHAFNVSTVPNCRPHTDLLVHATLSSRHTSTGCSSVIEEIVHALVEHTILDQPASQRNKIRNPPMETDQRVADWWATSFSKGWKIANDMPPMETRDGRHHRPTSGISGEGTEIINAPTIATTAPGRLGAEPDFPFLTEEASLRYLPICIETHGKIDVATIVVDRRDEYFEDDKSVVERLKREYYKRKGFLRSLLGCCWKVRELAVVKVDIGSSTTNK